MSVRYKKVVLFQNPASGAPNPETRSRVRQRLEAISDTLVEVTFDRHLDLAGRAAETMQENADLVVVAGGDGTVREVAGALVSTDMTLAIVPLGTFNNLALSLKLPADPTAVCDLIEAGLTRRIDVGMADEQHAFFEAAGVGVDADLFPIGEEVKGRRFEGVGRAIRLALLHRQSSVEILFDRPLFAAYQSSFRGSEPLKRRRRRFRGVKNQVRLRCSIVVIANGPYSSMEKKASSSFRSERICLMTSTFAWYSGSLLVSTILAFRHLNPAVLIRVRIRFFDVR